ncbi:MAG: pyrroline-5-carboxylate reductase [Propionibacteriaceae bacterium]|jgi:pyrroline-5-carboxylate reductase|nr:pyrroline-5-carboxylate reductase [Propionibacteriaceae bacterium]
MTTAILGVGVMGEIILAGLLRAGTAPEDLRVTTRRPKRQARLAEKYGVAPVTNAEAVAGADTVLVVVKPQDVPDILAEIGPALAPGALIVSLAAGVETAMIDRHLPDGHPVVRVMPNTPSSVGEGMAAISAGPHATKEHLDRVTAILSSVGQVVVVPEKYQNAVTAISGSGPAYVMFVVEAMIDAGVMLGLPRVTASDLVIQTVFGSAKLLRDSGEHPTVLRENVTSPGGTTTAALREFEAHRVKAAFMDAMEAACRRSEALGRAQYSD